MRATLFLCGGFIWVALGASSLADPPPMVLVRGGTLPRGSELAGQVVGDFSIGSTEVTWGEWKVVREWAATKGYDLAGVGGTCPANGADNLPVVNVSWYDVVKWCNAWSEKEGKAAVYRANGGVYRSGAFENPLSAVTMKRGANGYRLPLDKEWEWAARGGVSSIGYTYSGSNVAGEVAWTIENTGVVSAHAVGGKKANELGLYDMSGNVKEWVWDSWPRVRARGGDYNNSASICTVVYRFKGGSNVPTYSGSANGGFRVVLSSVP